MRLIKHIKSADLIKLIWWDIGYSLGQVCSCSHLVHPPTVIDLPSPCGSVGARHQKLTCPVDWLTSFFPLRHTLPSCSLSDRFVFLTLLCNICTWPGLPPGPPFLTSATAGHTFTSLKQGWLPAIQTKIKTHKIIMIAIVLEKNCNTSTTMRKHALQ